MCPDRRIDEHDYLAFVVELVHGATEPLDFYRSHAEFTRTDEPRDYVAQANDNVGFEFGYGRPDLGEYEFVDEETRAEIEEFLNWVWPEVLRVRDYESEGESGDDEDKDENESGSNEDEQQVGGDVDGGRVRTNTDSTTTTTTTAGGGGEEQDLSTNSEHTNPDNNTPAAPASSNTSTQQATRLAANNDASAGEAQARND